MRGHRQCHFKTRKSFKHNVMEIIGIFGGLVVGFVAKQIKPARDPRGFIITILLGIGGALLAGWVGGELGFYEPGEPAGFIASVIGAIIVLIPCEIYQSATSKAGFRSEGNRATKL